MCEPSSFDGHEPERKVSLVAGHSFKVRPIRSAVAAASTNGEALCEIEVTVSQQSSSGQHKVGVKLVGLVGGLYDHVCI